MFKQTEQKQITPASHSTEKYNFIIVQNSALEQKTYYCSNTILLLKQYLD